MDNDDIVQRLLLCVE